MDDKDDILVCGRDDKVQKKALPTLKKRAVSVLGILDEVSEEALHLKDIAFKNETRKHFSVSQAWPAEIRRTGWTEEPVFCEESIRFVVTSHMFEVKEITQVRFTMKIV